MLGGGRRGGRTRKAGDWSDTLVLLLYSCRIISRKGWGWGWGGGGGGWGWVGGGGGTGIEPTWFVDPSWPRCNMLELLIMPYFDIRSRGEAGRGGGGGGGGGGGDMRGEGKT